MSRGYKLLKHLREIQTHDGLFYVTDCQPFAIKADCTRLDCPMRTLALPPENTEGAAQFQCDPTGDLADVLISLRRTQGNI